MSADMSAGHVQRERERAREREKQIEREREREIDVLEMVGEQEYMIEELLEKQREREKEMEGDNEKDMLDEELLKKDALGALGGLAAGSWAAQDAPDPAAQGQEQRLASLLGERSKGGRRSPFDTPPALVRNASSSGFSSSGKLRRGKRDSEDLLDTFADLVDLASMVHSDQQRQRSPTAQAEGDAFALRSNSATNVNNSESAGISLRRTGSAKSSLSHPGGFRVGEEPPALMTRIASVGTMTSGIAKSPAAQKVMILDSQTAFPESLLLLATMDPEQDFPDAHVPTNESPLRGGLEGAGPETPMMARAREKIRQYRLKRTGSDAQGDGSPSRGSRSPQPRSRVPFRLAAKSLVRRALPSVCSAHCASAA
eukprot:Tamp_08390.p1 GENE.Tamp_08390~~Tamp_08390.p1  ORF type:complete len:392 (-),score=44.67 Tamp_08390:1160-2269(-)